MPDVVRAASRRMRHLLPGCCFAFALGATGVLVLPALPTPVTLLGLLVCAVLPAACRRRAAGWPLAAILGFALAAGEGHRRLDERLNSSLEGTDLEVTGFVASLPVRGVRSLRFDFDIVSGTRSPLRARLSWYERGDAVRPGDCLRLVLRLKRPRGVVNAAGFDFERYALVQRIAATGYVLRVLDAQACAPRPDIDRLRAVIADSIDAGLKPGRIRATVKGLAIGDTRELGDADWDLFRATGTTHLIAISGLHVGLAGAVGSGLAWLLWWLWPRLCLRVPRPQAMAVAALLSAGAYTLIAGATLPTLRTWLTLAAMLAGVLVRREVGWWTRYALALVAVLLCDPLAVLAAGFWLSFGAVAWLILAFGRGWRPQAWWRRWLLPQLGLTLALCPLGLAFFQQASLAAPLVNLLAVPWVTFVVVPVLLLALLCAPLSGLAALLWQLAAWLLLPFDTLVATASNWPLGRWTLPAPTPTSWVLALLGTAMLLAPRGWPGRALGIFGLLPLLWPAADPIPPGVFELTLLDVGQGQAALVRTATHALLVDTGPEFPDGDDLGDRVLAPTLAQLGVRALDGLIVSHDDLDHAGGTASLRRRLPVAGIQSSAPSVIAGARHCLAGQRWSWDGIDFEILHPPPLLPYLGNESSCVLRIAGPGGSALIPGDIGEVIEGRLLREQAEKLDVDLLIAGHHGSAGSSSAAFLAAVSPHEIWYSAGHRNRFRFPRAEVLQRARAVGAAQWSTATAGALHRRIGAGRATSGARDHLRRWWREPPGELDGLH